jgi:hypothetical protein
MCWPIDSLGQWFTLNYEGDQVRDKKHIELTVNTTVGPRDIKMPGSLS